MRYHLALLAAVLALSSFALPLAGQPVAPLDPARSVSPAPSSAQTAAVAPAATLHNAPALAAWRGNAAVGVRADAPTSAAAPVSLPLPYRARTSRNVAMMIVGGAGLIVGAVVGGDSGTIIMIGGGVIGLLGLWGYLQ